MWPWTTVFENCPKSLIQNCERSGLSLRFEWKSLLKMVHFGEFLKIWSVQSNSVTRQVTFNRTKTVENVQIQIFKCVIFSNFQTFCYCDTWYVWMQGYLGFKIIYPKHNPKHFSRGTLPFNLFSQPRGNWTKKEKEFFFANQLIFLSVPNHNWSIIQFLVLPYHYSSTGLKNCKKMDKSVTSIFRSTKEDVYIHE